MREELGCAIGSPRFRSGLFLTGGLCLMLAIVGSPDSSMAKMDPPKTKAAAPNRLPQGTQCYRSAGHWTCSAPDGSLWTCNSNANGSINTEDCACVSGCKRPQGTPTPTPRMR